MGGKARGARGTGIGADGDIRHQAVEILQEAVIAGVLSGEEDLALFRLGDEEAWDEAEARLHAIDLGPQRDGESATTARGPGGGVVHLGGQSGIGDNDTGGVGCLGAWGW